MKLSNMHFLSLASVIIMICLQSCTFFNAKTYSNSSGWDYNSPENGGFENVQYEAAPKIPKKAMKYFKDMKLIFGGPYSSALHDIEISKRDTLLLSPEGSKRVTVGSFYICDHEVTNAEYREFTDWVKNKLACEILAKHYSKYRDPNGSYNEKMAINWSDTALLGELYYPESAMYYRRKEIDTRKLIYKYYLNGRLIETAIYPDTLVWNDLPNSAASLSGLYFWHETFKNHPVVGVSFNQAQAYCKWRTDRFNEDILIARKIVHAHSYQFTTETFLSDSAHLKYQKFMYPNFRLPTNEEWEYAAIGSNKNMNRDNMNSSSGYPWPHSGLTDKKGKYLANFGQITDRNNICFKTFIDDGYFHTSPVKEYLANNFGLFDMAGNVAEWVLGEKLSHFYVQHNIELSNNIMDISIDHNTNIDDLDSNKQFLDTSFQVSADDNIEEASNKILLLNSRNNFYSKLDTNSVYEKRKLRYLAICEIHDAEVRKRQHPHRIIKGGSWNDGPVYLRSKCVAIFNKNKCSATIGFRVAMPRVIIRHEINNRKE